MSTPGVEACTPALEISTEVTQLLRSMREGDEDALDQALRSTWDALHRMARGLLHRESHDLTLSATELINEAYLRLFAGKKVPEMRGRGHMLALVARAMRQVLIDAARRRKAQKRPQVSDRRDMTAALEAFGDEVDPDGLEEALTQLEALAPRQASIVEMRFFIGLSEEQIGHALDVSPRTVQREWRMARAWLRRELGEDG